MPKSPKQVVWRACRPELGHFRGGSRVGGPKQEVYGMRMDIFAAIAALKVQSKWCVACRMDIFAAAAAL